MKLKTSELQGTALDYAVTKIEIARQIAQLGFKYTNKNIILGAETDYSSEWALGGAIIEREFISIFDLPSGLDIHAHPTFKSGDLWEAEIIPQGEDSIRYCGQTPLIAAMRCYVASKLGDVVDIPEELIQK